MPTLSVENVSIYYEEAGAGSPVLLLHGLGSSGRDWELVRDRLAAEHRIVIPDVRGHGRSDKPKGPYSVPLHARDVAALCDRLGLGGLHVVGLSMGGMIAFELAVARPELVRSLVIINSGPDMVLRTLKMRVAIGLRLAILRLFGPQRLAKLIAKKLFPKAEQAELRQRTESALGSNDPETYLAATRGLIGWSVLHRLSEIRCPVLVLASERDYTPISAKQSYVDRLKDARLVPIKDSGHAAPLDQPARVGEAMSRFFREIEAREIGGAT